MLGGEAIVAFPIMLRLRSAWAVTLKQVWGRTMANPHALRFGEGVAPHMPNVITDVVEAYRSPHGRDTLEFLQKFHGCSLRNSQATRTPMRRSSTISSTTGKGER